jgi:hypothetical protein
MPAGRVVMLELHPRRVSARVRVPVRTHTEVMNIYKE